MTERTFFSSTKVSWLRGTSILDVIYSLLRLRLMSAAVVRVPARD